MKSLFDITFQNMNRNSITFLISCVDFLVNSAYTHGKAVHLRSTVMQPGHQAAFTTGFNETATSYYI